MGWGRDNDGGMMDNWNGYSHGFGHSFNYGYGILMGLLTLAFVILLVLTFYRIGKMGKGVSGLSSGKESPKDILDRRLANGEISVEDYQKAKDALGV